MLHPAAPKIHSIKFMDGKRWLMSVFSFGGVHYEHGEWGEVAPSNWSRVEFTFELYLTVFIICCLALPWQTGEPLEMISVMHLNLAPHPPPTPSCIRFNAYQEGSTCFLRGCSRWCLPLSTSHTEHHYNTVCHWIGRGHCCSHTCDADSAGKEGGWVPDPHPTFAPPLQLHLPSGCFIFTKASKPLKNGTAHCELLNP